MSFALLVKVVDGLLPLRLFEADADAEGVDPLAPVAFRKLLRRSSYERRPLVELFAFSPTSELMDDCDVLDRVLRSEEGSEDEGDEAVTEGVARPVRLLDLRVDCTSI